MNPDDQYTLRMMCGEVDVDWSQFDQYEPRRRKISIQEYRQRTVTNQDNPVVEDIMSLMSKSAQMVTRTNNSPADGAGDQGKVMNSAANKRRGKSTC